MSKNDIRQFELHRWRLAALAALICLVAAWLLLFWPQKVTEYRMEMIPLPELGSLPGRAEPSTKPDGMLWNVAPHGELVVWLPHEQQLHRYRKEQWQQPANLSLPHDERFSPGNLIVLASGKPVFVSNNSATLWIEDQLVSLTEPHDPQPSRARIRGAAEQAGVLYALVEDAGRQHFRRDLVRWDAGALEHVVRVLQISETEVANAEAPSILVGADQKLLWLADSHAEGVLWFGYAADGRLQKKWLAEPMEDTLNLAPLQATKSGLYVVAESRGGRGRVLLKYDKDGKLLEQIFLPGVPTKPLPQVTETGEIVRLQSTNDRLEFEVWRRSHSWRWGQGGLFR